ncbi:hypothetical protein BJX61DRAFT_382058 [Aspergillus egyptiacus]|nr:hypothetical protein BJX61DRAFT_382058 [Aspergillus egyptiacus]
MSPRPRKLQRISKACDFCHRRSIKCSKNNGSGAPCQNCEDFGVSCTYNRPARRRGAQRQGIGNASPSARNTTQGLPPGHTTVSASLEPPATVTQARPTEAWSDVVNGARVAPVSARMDGPRPDPWKALAVACQTTIRDLAQVYLEIVYPIFPLFHWPSFSRALDNLEYLRDDGLFASTMAMCALTSARARDGALYSGHWSPGQLANPPAEVFWAAAKASIPRDLAQARDTEYMRACAILSIASIQTGQIQDMQQYLGIYHAIAGMDGLHDEELWPKDLDPVVVEVRRRLFWSLYTLDVYSSIVWGRVVRHREAQSNVRYPGQVKDDFISLNDQGDSPSNVTPGGRNSVDWICGWNFTTDLYRILEHAVDTQRRFAQLENGLTDVWALFRPAQTAGSWLMDHVLSMYEALPRQFRETRPVKCVLAHDIFGFQSANIQATLQLLRMVLSSSEDHDVNGKCDIAGHVLNVFSTVPIEYLKAISSPLLHHLAGIGYILGSVMEGTLSEMSYQRVRTLLLEMADLLHRLESGFRRSTGTSERLRAQVSRIDDYMRTQSTNTPPSLPGPPSILDPELPQGELVSVHSNTVAPIQAPISGTDESIANFQLPPELLDDWPWPFDTSLSEGICSLPFIK